ncbi:ferredoxin reductase family protein [Thauera aromatica]|uniref:Putative flavocytochrome n=1 Tax=Thauera aromatica K172 TaxID=44139 RepID=A0A2R4BI47_THAAR|nr:ferric reductase-like transmembrane domain-containing protein [Thauera aromatica]AVR86991.1 putative flavocytochrome [Thauera aromatica K172]
MKNIRFAYAGLLLLLSLLWWLADPLLPDGYGYFALRTVLINYTGVLAIGVMSVGMMLALRPVRVEPLLDGLDKTYRLHKWLGITGLVVSVIHWLWAQGTKWAVGWGWLVKPERVPGPPLTDPVEAFFRAQRGLAESVGEWAFYAAVVLIALALSKRFPYRLFFKTHRLLALAYLALVFHSVLLTPFSYWTQPMGVVLALLMAGGSVAAAVSLAGRVGHRRKAVAEIEELVNFPDNRVLKVAIRFKDRWPGHAAGQFAFVTFSAEEGAHPFTISSGWQGDGRLFFLIKGIGDYTARLPELVHVGDLVTVEGPYGRFDFANGGVSGKRRQIWVGAGIGITPFIARLKALAVEPDGRKIDLFYSTAEPDDEFIGRLQRDAKAAGVNLHIVVSARDGRLDVDRICSAVPGWAEADVWFCGPGGFGQALRTGFVAKGLLETDFHQELFHMR